MVCATGETPVVPVRAVFPTDGTSVVPECAAKMAALNGAGGGWRSQQVATLPAREAPVCNRPLFFRNFLQTPLRIWLVI